jgi:hypothetical protein
VKLAALKELLRVCRVELRLLEPVEKRKGFYWGRVFMVDGMRPIPRKAFDGLDYEIGWDAIMGVFSFVRITVPV